MKEKNLEVHICHQIDKAPTQILRTNKERMLQLRVEAIMGTIPLEAKGYLIQMDHLQNKDQ